VKVGDTVRWVWMSSGHSVVSGTDGNADNQFCSPSNTGCDNPPLSSNGFTFEHTFTQPGTFPYYCSVHFSLGMTGTITVQQRRADGGDRHAAHQSENRVPAGRPLRCALCEDDRCGE